MSVSPALKRRVAQLRAEYVPPMPIKQAVAIARFETKDWSESKYPFLAEFGEYTHDKVSGEVGPFEVTVWLDPDYDSHIGDDDVTGTFHEFDRRYEDGGRPENGVRCSYGGQNGGQGAYWYVPGNATLELTDYYLKEGRLSRAQIDEAVRAQIQRDMRDDADREYYNVNVTVSFDGEELAQTSLGGIDSLGNASSSAYFRDVAEDLIDEAIEEARLVVPLHADIAQAHADSLRSIVADD